ncbi:discoidin domain-containing protein [Alloscardovia criceti]|uniref:discoidin domain-containing protein n=1 Tax=Alloscardovia criceti TaxID=356828 RepID=UPI00036E663A|nr:discoidin domain-containing protein [Alloscardovia criceti]
MKTSKPLAAFAAASLLAMGTAIPASMFSSPAFAEDTQTVTVTPNPWYAHGTFDGWGTSLAWFANATGKYGEEGFVTNRDDISEEAYQKALENGKKLRQDFYNSIFSSDGLDLNMARYNIGGGNASDVAYDYPFMRQGAAVPGYWADDPTGSHNLYGGISTTQNNKDEIAKAFDPADKSQYDWSKGLSQEWWIEQGHKTGDITHIETFANSAPWFLTSSGYATGGSNSSTNNLQDPEKFAQYLLTVTNYLEQKYGVNVNTIEPFNESETNYWGTPSLRAGANWDAYYNDSGKNTTRAQNNIDLVNRYWQRYFSDKNKDVTPYSTAVKKPQEGMHVSNDMQQKTIKALHALMDKNDQTIIAATDATDSGHLVNSYNAYSSEIRNMIGQYNTHSYGTNNQRVARDIAQSEGKELSMSEVDGAWQSGGFNPYEFSNGLGMAGKINSDIYALQSKDFNFWQVVEDLYNMSTGSTDVYGNEANPAGENTNWGTVFISFDCTVADEDGNLYSERDVDNNEGKTEGLQPCSVIVNSKYNAVRAYTKFIHEGDSIIANNRTSDTLTAKSNDDKTQKIIHTNSSSQDQTLIIDLSQYGTISSDASARLFLTTSPAEDENSTAYFGATPEYMNTFSNVEQKDAVKIDVQAKTAMVTVPARSIASIELSGVSGVAENAGIKSGHTYELVGQSSNKILTAQATDDSALSIQDSATTPEQAALQSWTFHEVTSPSLRPSLHQYIITGSESKVLISKNGTNALESMSVDEAKQNPAAIWIVNTENGSSFSFTNKQAQRSMDVNNQDTAAGTKVGLWLSGGGAHQAWYVRSMEAINAQDAIIHTAVGSDPVLPEQVMLNYTWGTAQSSSVVWDTEGISQKVQNEGTFDISGKAQTLFGQEIPVTAHVHVGALTVTDPASITIAINSTVDDVKEAAPSTVNAHILSSPSFTAPVTWDFSGLTKDLLEKEGSFSITGTAQDTSSGSDLPAMLTVYVTQRNTLENIAPDHATATASSTEGSYSASNTIDKQLNTNWSNWKSGGGDTNPWLKYDFDKAYPVDEIHFYVDQKRAEAAPSKIVVQAKNEKGEWEDVSETSAVETEQGKATVIALPHPVFTQSIRLNLSYSSKEQEDYFAKVSEVQIMAKVNNSPASDASLADLRLDGTQLPDFNQDTRTYTVDLADDVTTYPLVQAYARDTSATISIEQASVNNRGVSVIQVTSADGSVTEKTTVIFGELQQTHPTPEPNPDTDPSTDPETDSDSDTIPETDSNSTESSDNNSTDNTTVATNKDDKDNQHKSVKKNSTEKHESLASPSGLANTGSSIRLIAVISMGLMALALAVIIGQRFNHKEENFHN